MPYLYNDEDNEPMNTENFPVEPERDCEHCKHYDGKYCTQWDCQMEIEEPLPFTDPPEQIPADRNCHERCRYSKQCYELYKTKGSNRADYPDECALFYKLDDLAMDAADILEEQRRARGEED
jgi:hypothetical protein